MVDVYNSCTQILRHSMNFLASNMVYIYFFLFISWRVHVCIMKLAEGPMGLVATQM